MIRGPGARRPGALALLGSHTVQLGPITWETWQGSEGEVSAAAGAECSSAAGKFENGPGEKNETY